jgi:hypothetical protein
MNPAHNRESEPEELDSALRTLNSVEAPADLVDQVTRALKYARTRRERRSGWRPLLLTPLAFAVVVLACITFARQSSSWRPQVPPVGRTPSPSRTVTIPDSVSVLPSRPGGRRVLPAQPLPMSATHRQPTVPFVYPQTREEQLRLQSAAEARVTDKAVFDPRSSVETTSSNAPK